jgi:hypothetical protein
VGGESGGMRDGELWEEGEVAQRMYTHVSKCQNNKIKLERNKNKLSAH